MSAADDARRRSATAPGAAPTFSLEHFGWGAPDRLELAGVFSGIGGEAAGDPLLAVQGPDATHRLPAIPRPDAGPPDDGGRWTAAFAWQEAPVAFDRARLEI